VCNHGRDFFSDSRSKSASSFYFPSAEITPQYRIHQYRLNFTTVPLTLACAHSVELLGLLCKLLAFVEGPDAIAKAQQPIA
jgi:hypothetical protein